MDPVAQSYLDKRREKAEKAEQYKKDYYRNNKEKMLQNSRNYYLKNREAILSKAKAARQALKDQEIKVVEITATSENAI